MQYSVVALAAFVATASASGYYPGTNSTTTPPAVHYTTKTYPETVTTCPSPTTITYGTNTYTVTKPTTLTLTECTVAYPVTTTSQVYCTKCQVPTYAPVQPNVTVPVVTKKPQPTLVEANSGNKVLALSGASLAGLLGLAAYIL